MYPDEEGKKQALCAAHSRARGTWTVMNPCADCAAEGVETEAGYKDEEGKKRLCAGHAKARGTWVSRG